MQYEKQSSKLFLFCRSVFLSLVCALVAHRYFHYEFEMAFSALVAISHAVILDHILEKNRYWIWEEKRSPWEANTVTAIEMSLIFFGVLAVSLGYYVLNWQYQQGLPSDFFQNSFSFLLYNNFGVLLTCFFMGAVFGVGGVTIVLAWNGVHWAESFVEFGRFLYAEDSASLIKLVVVVPHLFFEVIAYILSGLSGTFFTKGVIKYKLFDNRLFRVSIACLAIMAVAFVFLLLNVTFEILVAQRVLGS